MLAIRLKAITSHMTLKNTDFSLESYEADEHFEEAIENVWLKTHRPEPDYEQDFNVSLIQGFVQEILDRFENTGKVHAEKTRIGKGPSSARSCCVTCDVSRLTRAAAGAINEIPFCARG
jgi:hypothetical protein